MEFAPTKNRLCRASDQSPLGAGSGSRNPVFARRSEDQFKVDFKTILTFRLPSSKPSCRVSRSQNRLSSSRAFLRAIFLGGLQTRFPPSFDVPGRHHRRLVLAISRLLVEVHGGRIELVRRVRVTLDSTP
jgi:hypothetical protein